MRLSTCSNCRFWQTYGSPGADGETVEGICHRLPSPQDMTPSFGWCGQHRHRATTIAAVLVVVAGVIAALWAGGLL